MALGFSSSVVDGLDGLAYVGFYLLLYGVVWLKSMHAFVFAISHSLIACPFIASNVIDSSKIL